MFIPSTWNYDHEDDQTWSAPTSYYAAVHAKCRVTIVQDPESLADMLRRQMAQMQPDGGHPPIEAGDSPYGRMLASIRGVSLQIVEARQHLLRRAGNA